MIKERNWLVIINPVAGKGNGNKNWPQIAKLLTKNNVSFKFIFSEYKGHIAEIIREQVISGNYHFLICGGDGSLHEAVNASMNFSFEARQKIILGVIPIGSGNDWCRTHFISNDYTNAIKQFANGTITGHDVGIAVTGSSSQKHYFINIAGAGYDGYVAENINRLYPKNKPGKTIYMITLLKCLLGYKCTHAQIKTESLTINERIFSVSVSICKYNGGGMMQAPQAIYNDGLLTVNIIKDLNQWQVLKNLSGLKDGSYINHRQVVSCQSKTVSIRGENMLIEADGENLGSGYVEFDIEPLALKIVLP